MYYYIVDPQKISQKDFERVQNQLYSSVSEYHVAGEVVRSTGLRTINQLVENAFVHGAKTLVAVGNEDTLQDVINAVAGREMVIGYVPIIESEIGRMLGILSIDQAAKTLAGRRVEELDLGRVNNNLFLSKLSFGVTQASTKLLESFNFKILQSLFRLPNFEIKFTADDEFQGSLQVVGGLIQNLSNPTDGVLDVALLAKLSKWQTFKSRKAILSGEFAAIEGSSLIHVRKLEILTPIGLPLRVGNRTIAKTPAVIEALPKALKIIVGKERKF